MSLLLLLSQPNFASNPNDSTGFTDAGQAYGREGATSDDRGLTDSATTQLTSGTNWTQSLTDSTGLTDAGQTYGLEGATSDDRGAVDTATPNLTSGTNWTQSLTDSTGLTDAGQVQGREGSTVDDRGATDTATPVTSGGTAITRTITDDRGQTDAGQSIGRSGATTDATGSTDTATASKFFVTGTNYLREPTDSTGLTDAVSLTYGEVFNESTGLAEDPGPEQIAIDEVLATEDRGAVDSVIVVRPASSTDDRGLVDLVALSIGDSLAELVGLTDSVSAVVTFTRSIADTATLSDSQSTLRTPGGGTDADGYVSDALPLVDSVALAQSASFVDPFLSDTVYTTVTGTAQAYTVTITDSLGAADARAFDLALQLLEAGVVGSDTATREGDDYLIDIEDELGLVDDVRAPGPGGSVRGGVITAPRARTGPVRRRTGSGVPVRASTNSATPIRPTATGGEQ